MILRPWGSSSPTAVKPAEGKSLLLSSVEKNCSAIAPVGGMWDHEIHQWWEWKQRLALLLSVVFWCCSSGAPDARLWVEMAWFASADVQWCSACRGVWKCLLMAVGSPIPLEQDSFEVLAASEKETSPCCIPPHKTHCLGFLMHQGLVCRESQGIAAVQVGEAFHIFCSFSELLPSDLVTLREFNTIIATQRQLSEACIWFQAVEQSLIVYTVLFLHGVQRRVTALCLLLIIPPR